MFDRYKYQYNWVLSVFYCNLAVGITFIFMNNVKFGGKKW